MTRGEVIEMICESLTQTFGLKRLVPARLLRQIVRYSVVVTFQAIEAALKHGESVTILNFGRFDVQVHKARMGNTMRGGVATPLEIPERSTVRFRPSPRLKKRMEDSMEKLGVQVDEGKMKTAQKGGQDKCGCGQELDKTANVPKCPVHGTKPFEPGNKEQGK